MINDCGHNLFFPSGAMRLGPDPGGGGISLTCTGTGNTVIHNFVNEAYWGIPYDNGTNTITPNSFSYVTNISAPC